MISVFDRVEKIVGKGENAGYQHYLLFRQCFQKTSFSGSLKVGIVWEKLNRSVDTSNSFLVSRFLSKMCPYSRIILNGLMSLIV